LQDADSTSYAHRLVRKTIKNKQPQYLRATVSADFQPSDTTHIEVGMQVAHPKFGRGMVRQLDTSSAARKATIDFADFGEKTLLLGFAKLRIISSEP
jgi:DNA helicase-2/ATP-dependent DNA helicase PcrA